MMNGKLVDIANLKTEVPHIAEEVRYIGDLQRVTVHPGDKFVLSVDFIISDETRNRLQAEWERFMGHEYPIIVLSPGMKLGVIGKE